MIVTLVNHVSLDKYCNRFHSVVSEKNNSLILDFI